MKKLVKEIKKLSGLTGHDFVEAVAVAQVVVALELLRPLAESATLHVRSVVLQQRLLELSDGRRKVALVVQLHRCGEAALGWNKQTHTLGIGEF